MSFSHAFITGGSSGIGLSVARALAQSGCHVVIAARRQSVVESIAADFRKEGLRVDGCTLDVTDPVAVRHSIQHWDQASGGLDLVIANAGVGTARAATDLTVEGDILPVIQVNVIGALTTLVEAIRVMLPRGKGTLVGVSSLAGQRGLPGCGAYSASKAALSAFLETLRADLTPAGLRVVDVRPGFVDTPMTEGNRFRMPFLMSPHEAADRIVKGLEAQSRTIIAFPWPMVAALDIAATVPDRLWDHVATKYQSKF